VEKSRCLAAKKKEHMKKRIETHKEDEVEGGKIVLAERTEEKKL